LHDKDVLEVIIPPGGSQLERIAISSEGGKVYISDLPFGVYVVDVKTKLSARLPQSVGISFGSDGLYSTRTV
jgi:hypothetical protein